MADINLPGFPLTLSMYDLRLKADKLLISGHQEEGRLLHGLLDGYEKPRPSRIEEIREEMHDLRDEARGAEKRAEEAEERAEDAETRLSQISELVEEAGERMERALGALARGDRDGALVLMAEALGLLVNAPLAHPEGAGQD